MARKQNWSFLYLTVSVEHQDHKRETVFSREI
jgi:hypothetical protein